MTVRIQDLGPGDELQVWMRNGLAIKPTITGKGKPYYRVPAKAARAEAGDLTRFLGWVVENNTTTGVLTVHVSPMNSLSAVGSVMSPPAQVSVHYKALRRVRKLSSTTYPGRTYTVGPRGTSTTKRPGSKDHFEPRPYRTVTEVLLR